METSTSNQQSFSVLVRAFTYTLALCVASDADLLVYWIQLSVISFRQFLVFGLLQLFPAVPKATKEGVVHVSAITVTQAPSLTITKKTYPLGVQVIIHRIVLANRVTA